MISNLDKWVIIGYHYASWASVFQSTSQKERNHIISLNNMYNMYTNSAFKTHFEIK